MAFEQHWKTERSFWLDGPDFHANHLAEAACMVFPAPVGILSGSAITEALTQAPRWTDVDFEATCETVSKDTVVLAYKAIGQRPDALGPAYAAYCASTYVREGDAWKLLAHQQSPA
tara:strand:- start:77 stop:424 length:348 start_codon:yes stop_codon:yes gene_type:complete